MALIQFNVPPLPHYIIGGFYMSPPGGKHPNRRNIGVFDLLVISDGCLYIGEEDKKYELKAGHALILRPDCFHYAVKESEMDVSCYWIHFDTTGSWAVTDERRMPDPDKERDALLSPDFYKMQTFTIELPQFAPLVQPERTYELLQQLNEMNGSILSEGIRWKQQSVFQEILQQLSASARSSAASPVAVCAEKAASYLRHHYREAVTAQSLGEHLNFHPVYIARCMQREFGCSPSEYLMRYRIEQSKLLLLQTDLAIARIAEEVGFNHPAYFTACFAKYEGTSPRKFRQHFSHG